MDVKAVLDLGPSTLVQIVATAEQLAVQSASKM